MAQPQQRWMQEMTERLEAIKFTEEKQIYTESFIACFKSHTAKLYGIIFGGEGMISSQLGGDLENNITKINRHYEANKEKYVTLERMVMTELETKGKEALLAEKDVAVKGVLWLTRTLNFICTLLEKLCEAKGTDAATCAQQTYSETLEPYHGWFGRTTFSSTLGWITDTEKLLQLFGFSSEEEFKQVAIQLTTKLRPFISHNFALLDKYDVHFKYKVM